MLDNFIVLLANGEMPSSVHCHRLLYSARSLVCCDGALATARLFGCEPDYVVGDGDSIALADKQALGARYLEIAEQDSNDLDKAFRVIPKLYGADSKVVILGASGLREDHIIGNVFRLPGFAKQVADVQMVTDYGVFTVVLSERTYDCKVGGAVSIFAPEFDTHVTSKGLVWPLDNVVFNSLWCATLNRTNDTCFSLCTNKPIIVYQALKV